MSETGSEIPNLPLYETDYRAEFEPLKGRWRFRLAATGGILEVDVLVVLAEEWKERKESEDPSWSPVNFGQ